MKSNETVGMAVCRIVVRPMNDVSCRVANELAADLDRVAWTNRDRRRECDVVHHTNYAGGRLHRKCFMFAASARAEEILRRRCNRAAEIDLCAVTDRYRSCKIHSASSAERSRRDGKRQGGVVTRAKARSFKKG